jgi:predicted nucleic acid-binding protein
MDGAFTALATQAEVITISGRIPSVAAHAQDDLTLAIAHEGAADDLVTGDHELLRLRDYQGVHIVSPREFLTLLDTADDSNG